MNQFTLGIELTPEEVEDIRLMSGFDNEMEEVSFAFARRLGRYRSLGLIDLRGSNPWLWHLTTLGMQVRAQIEGDWE